VPDRPKLSNFLTVEQQLQLLASAQGLQPTAVQVAITGAGLTDSANMQIGQLSAGLYQRVAVAQALMGSPRLLLLDEPLGAVGPSSQRLIIAALERAKGVGATLIVATHQLMAFAGICDRVVHVSEGKLTELGPMTQVLAEARTRVLFTATGANLGLLPGQPIPASAGLMGRLVTAEERSTLVGLVHGAGGQIVHMSAQWD